MDCIIERIEADSRGRRRLRCKICRKVYRSDSPPEKYHINCRARELPIYILSQGVGTELTKLIKLYGVHQTESCSCAQVAQEMNRIGPAGVRWHKACFLDHLRRAYGELSILSKVIATVATMANSLPLSLEGLLDLAIERSENKNPPPGRKGV